jgi:hypothetical protein
MAAAVVEHDPELRILFELVVDGGELLRRGEDRRLDLAAGDAGSGKRRLAEVVPLP